MSAHSPWWTNDIIDNRIRQLRAEGVSLKKMCPVLLSEFHVAVTKCMIVRRTRTLKFDPMPSVITYVPRPSRAKKRRKSEARPRVEKPAKPPASAPPLRPRSVSGRQGSALMFRGLATLPAGAVVHVAGRCSWPLVCTTECSGRYCDEHRSLIRRAA